jgi:hypothetical protein
MRSWIGYIGGPVHRSPRTRPSVAQSNKSPPARISRLLLDYGVVQDTACYDVTELLLWHQLTFSNYVRVGCPSVSIYKWSTNHNGSGGNGLHHIT